MTRPSQLKLRSVLDSVGGQIRRDLKKDTPKIAILAEKAAWNEGIVAASLKLLPGMKMEIVGTWQPSAVATDLTAELSAIERSGAPLPDFLPHAKLRVRDAEALGIVSERVRKPQFQGIVST